ncbi:DNA-binding protein HU-beta [Blochmannia endosymbiont of Camponotus (Colobopsis) obliquus]|nr:DNA-binding protein HU-beta [Blochmannia endosymbiont of Camponotus (Colobopsis) obliquus]
MNRSQLIDKIVLDADISKKIVGCVLDSMINLIKRSLRQGHSVSLIGFGTFVVRSRSARVGRNPQTGKKILIPASKIPGFRPGKNFKNIVNKV